MNEGFTAASAALERLKAGNRAYLNADTASGDVSPKTRSETVRDGQKPFAVVVTCSDSRVIPEYIFSVGIGELFVVRVAGNVIDNHALGSIEYAVDHLCCKLVLVLGHTHCGAVAAASGDNHGYVKFITDEIKRAIGEETDSVKATILNVKHSVSEIETLLPKTDGLLVAGALYHTDSGLVDFGL